MRGRQSYDIPNLLLSGGCLSRARYLPLSGGMAGLCLLVRTSPGQRKRPGYSARAFSQSQLHLTRTTSVVPYAHVSQLGWREEADTTDTMAQSLKGARSQGVPWRHCLP